MSSLNLHGNVFGDYRTHRIILEIYDALAESMQTGKPYQTRLNPPPSDPGCCHPARAGEPKLSRFPNPQ